jgi:hypothetical protein
VSTSPSSLGLVPMVPPMIVPITPWMIVVRAIVVRSVIIARAVIIVGIVARIVVPRAERKSERYTGFCWLRSERQQTNGCQPDRKVFFHAVVPFFDSQRAKIYRLEIRRLEPVSSSNHYCGRANGGEKGLRLNRLHAE